MPSPENKIRLDVFSLFLGIAFPSPPRAAEWWKSLFFKAKLKWFLFSEASLPPMPVEFIASVFLQILILKQLPFCIRNFYAPIHLSQYTIKTIMTNMLFISIIPTTWTHETQYYGYCSMHHWWATRGVNTQIIMHILYDVLCFMMFALENVKLKIS